MIYCQRFDLAMLKRSAERYRIKSVREENKDNRVEV